MESTSPLVEFLKATKIIVKANKEKLNPFVLCLVS